MRIWGGMWQPKMLNFDSFKVMRCILNWPSSKVNHECRIAAWYVVMVVITLLTEAESYDICSSGMDMLENVSLCSIVEDHQCCGESESLSLRVEFSVFLC